MKGKCECGGEVYSKGLCRPCYIRLWKHGSTKYRRTPSKMISEHKETHMAWRWMKNRCAYKKHMRYYGGINVCARWLGADGFMNFLADMGDKPDGASLDRIDCSLGYSPENCRWANNSVQMYNRAKPSRGNTTTGIRGISIVKDSDGRKYIRAQITVNRRTIKKFFSVDRIQDAIKWRAAKERELFGFNTKDFKEI